MRFEIFIAARYLRARRRQAVVGLITAISVVGVAAGVASLIIALAITNGMRRDLQERLVGSTAHVELMRTAGDGMENWRELMARLANVPHVEAEAPGLYGQVLISRGARSGGALIKGIIPADERKVGNLLQSIHQGSADELDPEETLPTGATPPIVIGNELALTLGATVGDTLLVTSPQGELTPLGLVPRYQRFRIVGIFASGFYQYDSSYAFMRLADAQRLFFEQVVTFIVLALIVVVAALNILIALTMMVMEKTRDIAVMMSFGVRAEQIRRIFLCQGLLISSIGTVLGLIAGYAASVAGSHFKFIHLDASVYSIDYLPFAPRFTDALIVAAVSLGVSLLATLYPSSSAASVLPAEALRYE